MLPVLLAQSSQILGLFKDVKQISELQVAFEKIAKNLTKFASKNLGGAEIKFPQCTKTAFKWSNAQYAFRTMSSFVVFKNLKKMTPEEELIEFSNEFNWCSVFFSKSWAIAAKSIITKHWTTIEKEL